MAVHQITAADRITANISEADISGQVAVGKYIIMVGDVSGGVVNIALPEEKPVVTPRPTPVDLRPRRFRGLLDRKDETQTAQQAIATGQILSFYGVTGIGKTSLLRQMAYDPVTADFPDGVVYLSARDVPVRDLLQALFDAFYESDIHYVPTETAARNYLRDKRALILLDDANLHPDETDWLLDMAPNCEFVFAGKELSLWGEGITRQVRGLPLADATALFVQAVGRPLSNEEIKLATQLVAALKGHPLSILQAAALVQEDDHQLHTLIQQVTQEETSPQPVVASLLLTNRTPEEQQVLAALSAVGGHPLHPTHLAAISRVTNLTETLNELVQRQLVIRTTNGFALPDDVAMHLAQTWQLTRWREQALRYLGQWLTEQPHPSLLEILGQKEILLDVLQWGVKNGRFAQTLPLIRPLESALQLTGQWETWNNLLQMVEKAAAIAGDQVMRAWAWHEIGSRALVLGQKNEARRWLVRALRTRQALGDQLGAAVSRHNLSLLLPPPINSHDNNNGQGGNGRVPGGKTTISTSVKVLWSFIALMALALASIVWAEQNPPLSPTSIVPAPTLTNPVIIPPITPSNTTTATLPSPTSTQSPTSTHTSSAPTVPPCVPRTNWVPYVIRRGDTLAALSRTTGVSVAVIKAANCQTTDLIKAGEILYLPVWPVTPTPTLTHTPSPTPTETAVPVPVIEFWADSVELPLGSCTKLYWQVENVPEETAVYLRAKPNHSDIAPAETAVRPIGQQEVCPSTTTTYLLTILIPNTDSIQQTITLFPYDDQPPQLFEWHTDVDILTTSSECGKNTVTFSVIVIDNNGIASVTLWYKTGESTWQSATMRNTQEEYWFTLNAPIIKDHTILIWYIEAMDLVGNTNRTPEENLPVEYCLR